MCGARTISVNSITVNLGPIKTVYTSKLLNNCREKKKTTGPNRDVNLSNLQEHCVSVNELLFVFSFLISFSLNLERINKV